MSAGTLHAVILAGGSGTRFWPLSRELMPKQLLSIVGDRSMLALTLDRTLPLVPEERIWVVTTRSQGGEIKRELHNLGLSGVRVIEEPAGRNTAAAIGLSALHVLQIDPEGVLAVFPADHHIEQPQRFSELIQEAHLLASNRWLVTLGIRPTKPETGYGYIQHAGPLLPKDQEGSTQEAFRVSRFTEKPDLETAKRYLEAGDFFWNSGIFVWGARRLGVKIGADGMALS